MVVKKKNKHSDKRQQGTQGRSTNSKILIAVLVERGGNFYTNTAKSWIALLKRGIVGTFHHVSEQHLDCYVDELVFRCDNRSMGDGERMVKAVKGIEGKRLAYKDTVKSKDS